MTPVQAATILTQNFDDVSNLSGWSLINNSAPVGQPWFQGDNTTAFTAQAGADNSYIAASYLSANNGFGTVDNWLLTPTITLNGATTITFYTRGAADPGFTDTLQLLFGSGNSTSSYTTLLTVGGTSPYDTTWTQYTATVSGTGSGRFAFRYTGAGETASYIGIDTVSVSAVPEPGGYAMFAAGLGLVGLLRRRSRRVIGAGVALAALGLSQGAAAADQPGMVVVRDPVSGELRAPTAAEFQALQAASPVAKTRSAARVAAKQQTVQANGTRKVHVGTDSLVYANIARGADGQLHEACVQGDAAAQAALTTLANTSTPRKEQRDAQ